MNRVAAQELPELWRVRQGGIMRNCSLPFVLLLMLGSGANAQEAQALEVDLRLRSELASGPVYGGPTQNAVRCLIFNAGDRKKEVKTAEIFGFGSATPISGILNNCAAGVDAKSMCIYQATGIRGDNPYACKITFKDKDNFIRGQIEVGRVEADDRFTVLGSSTMD